MAVLRFRASSLRNPSSGLYVEPDDADHAVHIGIGSHTDPGIDDNFMKDLGTKLEPGSAALFVLAEGADLGKVLPAISEFGGHVVQTTLSKDTEKQLREAIRDLDQE